MFLIAITLMVSALVLAVFNERRSASKQEQPVSDSHQLAFKSLLQSLRAIRERQDQQDLALIQLKSKLEKSKKGKRK